MNNIVSYHFSRSRAITAAGLNKMVVAKKHKDDITTAQEMQHTDMILGFGNISLPDDLPPL